MSQNIKRILYATDLSKNSAYAFRYTTELAAPIGANIVILNVVEPLPPSAKRLLEPYLSERGLVEKAQEKLSHAIGRIQKRLQVFCDREVQNSPECQGIVESIEVVEGYPAEQILVQADKLDCDLIVMGTHGKDIIGYTFLGSTTQKVLRRARKPVFIVPLPEGDTDVSFYDE